MKIVTAQARRVLANQTPRNWASRDSGAEKHALPVSIFVDFDLKELRGHLEKNVAINRVSDKLKVSRYKLTGNCLDSGTSVAAMPV